MVLKAKDVQILAIAKPTMASTEKTEPSEDQCSVRVQVGDEELRGSSEWPAAKSLPAMYHLAKHSVNEPLISGVGSQFVHASEGKTEAKKRPKPSNEAGRADAPVPPAEGDHQTQNGGLSAHRPDKHPAHFAQTMLTQCDNYIDGQNPPVGINRRLPLYMRKHMILEVLRLDNELSEAGYPQESEKAVRM